MSTETDRNPEDLERIVRELETANRQLGKRLIEADAGAEAASGTTAARKLAKAEGDLQASEAEKEALQREVVRLRGQVADLQAQLARAGFRGIVRRVVSRLSHNRDRDAA